MKRLSAVLLMPDEVGQKTCSIAAKEGVALDAVIVNDLPALESAFSIRRELLLSFGTGVIVPSWILDLMGGTALNIHAASPLYPGRDPHHFAVYDGATEYGATMHFMSQNVDAGPIVDVELFQVPAQTTPANLLAQANEAGWLLITRFFERFLDQGAPVPKTGFEWGLRKTTRKMFQELCRIDPSMSKQELERRYRATAMPGFRNLYLDLHGYRFRIDDSCR
ncbi:MAG: hypothetical protein H6943_05990 [Zoogloeaceae bacterium]|nr:hypothetical protein [Zoogloeaceae bacterium]